MHLTNFSLNKNSENFVFENNAESGGSQNTQNAGDASKQSISQLFEQLEEQGINTLKIKKEIIDICTKVWIILMI
jgi:hypothetical protein